MLIDIYMKFLKISGTGIKLQSRYNFVKDKVPREITKCKIYGSCAVHVI